MAYFYSFLMGLFYGWGAILPVSGAAPLLMLQKAAPAALSENGGLVVLMQWSAAAALLFALRKTFFQMLKGVGGMSAGMMKGSFKWRKANRYQKMAVFGLPASLPLLLAAGLRHYWNYSALFGGSLLFLGVTSLLMGGLLFIGDHSLPGKRDLREMQGTHAIKLGLFQAFATLPGLSRMGTTLSMAMNMGFTREAAAEFSLVLAVPALIGAGFLKMNQLSALMQLPWLAVLCAFFAVVAAVYTGLWLLRFLIKRDRIGWLVVYCAGMGVLAIALHAAL